jgi:hypothetical protein
MAQIGLQDQEKEEEEEEERHHEDKQIIDFGATWK